MHTLDLLGDDVEVLGRMKGHIDPGHLPNRLSPLTSAVHHDLGFDGAAISFNSRDGAVFGGDGSDSSALEDLCTTHPGTPSE